LSYVGPASAFLATLFSHDERSIVRAALHLAGWTGPAKLPTAPYSDERGPTKVSDNLWLPTSAVVIRAFISAGQVAMACALAGDMLTRSPSLCDAAEVRAALVTALLARGNAQAAVAEAERLLTDPALPAALSAEVAATRLIGLVCYDVDTAERLAKSLLGRTDLRHDGLKATALTVAGNALWRRGRLAEALALTRAAVRTESNATIRFGSGEALGPARCFSQIVLVDELVSLGETAEADLVLRRLVERIGDFDRGPHGAMLSVAQAKVHARAGRLGAAAESANRGVALAGWANLQSVIPHARAVQASIAVRLGDHVAAAKALAACRNLTPSTHAEAGALRVLATLQLTESTDGPNAAGNLLSRQYRRLSAMPVVLSGEPTTAALLVRISLAASDQHLAEQTTAAARQLAAANPDLACVSAAAMHAEGVLKGDPDLLSRAATQHVDPWSRARAMEDRALILLAHIGSTDGRAAADALKQALDGYRDAGARGDEARTEACLRGIGWHGRCDRPRQTAGHGFPQLTPREAAVAELVAQGLTNQVAARHLHLSPHTVNFHLRRIFRKLSIRSRVELARIHGMAAPTGMSAATADVPTARKAWRRLPQP
jgi:ATP/maltotriose-dependent transcriptional regulator MalT